MKQKQQVKIKKGLQTNYAIDLKNLIAKKYILKKQERNIYKTKIDKSPKKVSKIGVREPYCQAKFLNKKPIRILITEKNISKKKHNVCRY